jgi:hypothetical protein
LAVVVREPTGVCACELRGADVALDDVRGVVRCAGAPAFEPCAVTGFFGFEADAFGRDDLVAGVRDAGVELLPVDFLATASLHARMPLSSRGSTEPQDSHWKTREP